MTDAIRLRQLSKVFGTTKVLHDLDLTVPEGSFTSLLGPSGCGKTTLLNLVGGLDRPTSGEIQLGEITVFSDRQAIDVPTERRNIGYVFQSYALWPHMTVVQNIAFPLRLRRLPKPERERKARRMLGRLELGQLGDRYPFQLSGGQQQRVAIARALVYEPRLLLLDEPLSNLDAQLRERARAWLKSVHEDFGLTAVLVTHDQQEALSLSDNIVLLSGGRIEQEGTAHTIYDRPQTAYAAEFVGGANVLRGKAGHDGVLTAGDGYLISSGSGVASKSGDPAAIAIRPQHIRFTEEIRSADGAVLPFELEAALYLGATHEIVGRTPLGPVRIISQVPPPASGALRILLPANDCIRVFPGDAPESPDAQ